MTRPDPTHGLATIAAAQALSLNLLRAELAALALLLPGKADGDPDTASAAAEAREARHAEAFEAACDDLPV